MNTIALQSTADQSIDFERGAGIGLDLFLPCRVIAYTGSHNPPPEASHAPRRRRPRFAVVARLVPLLWLVRPCSCGARVWPCRATLRTIRARLGWTAWIDVELKEWAATSRLLATHHRPD